MGLQTSRFVAAPLDWITARNNGQFSEWLVMNCKIHKSVKNVLDDGKHRIVCTEYETANFRSMSTWRKVVDAAMILDQTNVSLLSAVNASILSAEEWQCIHCQCISPFYWFQGNVLMDNMECAYCRRYNLFSFNVPERIVPCFECTEESMLKEYIFDYNNQKGAACPKCKVYQSDAFLKSNQFEKMKQYLSEKDEYEKKEKENNQMNEIYSPSYPVVDNVNTINSVDVEKKKSSFFRWPKRKKSVKSTKSLNDIKEDPSIIEDDFD